MRPHKGGYSHVPYSFRGRNSAKIRCATLWWKPPNRRLVWGVTTHVSDLNIITAWTRQHRNAPKSQCPRPPAPRPDFSGPPKVVYDSQTVVVSRCQEALQLLKGWKCFQYPVISLERHLCPFPSLILLHTLSLLFIPPCEEIQQWVEVLKCCSRYEHVTVWEVGVGAVPFLQNHHCVPHVEVHAVYPEFGASRFPTLAVPYWKPNGPV